MPSTTTTTTETTAAEAVTREWTQTGAQLFDAARATREGHNYATGRDAVVAGIDGLTWVQMPKDTGIVMPFSPGESVKALIYGLGLRDVRRIAWDGAVEVRDDVEGSRSLYSLLAVEFGERGGLVRLFAVDRGTDVLPVIIDRIPVPESPAPAPVVDPVTTVEIVAAELRRGDVILTADGRRAYAALDLRDDPRDADGTRNIRVLTSPEDQEAGHPAQVPHKGTDALTVARPTS